MMSDILQKHFGIQPEQSYMVRNQMRYISGGVLYTVVPVTHVEEDTLVELYEMSEHLSKEGDRYVSRFVPSTNEKFLVTENEVDYVVLGNAPHPVVPSLKLGRKLARFHDRGRSIDKVIKSCSRIGEWKSLWEKRLDQMEGVWNNYLMERPDREFSRIFIESYPYYMGLAENAIQYLVDTEMDEETRDSDAGTVCHVRFHEGTWGSEVCIKDPFDWVFDHASRDISEWIRERYFSQKRTFQPDIRSFLQEYESVSPLSAFSWRLIYARLLFPIHYFECIEDYFTASSEQTQKQLEDKLERMIKTSREYEAFLGNFYRIADVPLKKMAIPEIQWLKK
ncbi:spore coat putative kinase YutH [Falsibacillus pallidus]|nr:spore coat protein YutH [Falsibacillus pallidus]